MTKPPKWPEGTMLPGIERIVKELIARKFAEIDLLTEAFFQACDRGRRESRAESIVYVLERRFPGQIPVGLRKHLLDLTPEATKPMVLRLVGARSVADVLGRHMPADVPERPDGGSDIEGGDR
jgi:hypothetical protein